MDSLSFDCAVSVVIWYISNHLFELAFGCPYYIFEERSFSRWAAQEILARLMEGQFAVPEFISGHSNDSPVFIVQEFMNQMEYCSEQSSKPVFEVAAGVAKDILGLLKK